jgi:diaminopimelate decarboxylase
MARTEKEIISEAAASFDTPLYVYFAETIERKLKALRTAFSDLPHHICYAVKANSNLNILKFFHSRDCGFDIVSEGELLRLKEIGCEPKKIVFSGVGKTAVEIERALTLGVHMLNVESPAEIAAINEIAKKLKLKAKIALRINPDIDVNIHPYVATGLRSAKFGIPQNDVPDVLSLVRESSHIELIGIDCHIGSGIVEIDPLRKAYEQVKTVALSVKAQGFPITTLDLGGGFGVPFSGHYQALDMQALRGCVNAVFKDSPFTLIIEPGKYLIAEAGVLVTKVIYLKENNGKRFIIVDAGMNDLIRPALYEAYHKIDLLTDRKDARLATFDVVGPICETGCFFAHDRELEEPVQGELIAIRDAGAYGFTMASNYNSRRLPAEVLADTNGKISLIRKREAFDSMWQDEII